MKACKAAAQALRQYCWPQSHAHWIAAGFLIAGAASFGIVDADARLTQLVITERLPFAGGAQFGTAGAFERLKGTAFMEVDPNNPLDAVITDLDKAPRNARGMVEFSSPFFIIKPVDMSRGNHKIFSTVNNRGNDALLNATSVAAGSINTSTCASVTRSSTSDGRAISRRPRRD